jgi:hypothetical protein
MHMLMVMVTAWSLIVMTIIGWGVHPVIGGGTLLGSIGALVVFWLRQRGTPRFTITEIRDYFEGWKLIAEDRDVMSYAVLNNALAALKDYQDGIAAVRERGRAKAASPDKPPGSWLPPSDERILKPMEFPFGTLQVRQPLPLSETHCLILIAGGAERIVASHPNGYSCFELAKRIAAGDYERIRQQADFIDKCGGSVDHEEIARISNFTPVDPH